MQYLKPPHLFVHNLFVHINRGLKLGAAGLGVVALLCVFVLSQTQAAHAGEVPSGRVCSTPNLVIIDGSVVNTIMTIPDSAPIYDLNVYINAPHTWVGDLSFTLDHATATGTGPITIIDRPGVPASPFGCAGDDYDVTVDDEGFNGAIETQCDDSSAIHGSRVGGDPAGSVLSNFDGENINGPWVLSIADNIFGNTGTLVEWCLEYNNPGPRSIATCGGYEVFETGPGTYAAPDFAGNLIVGTNGNDGLPGTAGPDLILGLDGNDNLWGIQGDDVLCGGPGNDNLYGGNNNDYLDGGDGIDLLEGGDNDDNLTGGLDADTLNGGAGFDVLIGGAAGDTLNGGSENDSLYGYAGNDTLNGDEGNDRLFGGSGNDELFGNQGNDKLKGQGGNDDHDGGNGTDQCDDTQGSNSEVNCESGLVTTTRAIDAPSALALEEVAPDFDALRAELMDDGTGPASSPELKPLLFLPLFNGELPQ